MPTTTTTTTATPRDLAARLMQLPPVQWRAAVAGLTSTQLVEVENELDAVVLGAVRLAGYLRGVEGGKVEEDATHRAGVRKSNGVVAAVRRTLGYTYPRQDLSF